MSNFTISKDEFERTGVTKQMVRELISKYISATGDRYSKDDDYYFGRHDILNRVKNNKKAINNKIVCNHAKYISDISTGYFMSNPITYSVDEGDIDKLTDIFDIADVDGADTKNALNMSIYGKSYEYIYIKEGTTDIKIKTLKPQNCFIVTDDSIEENELFAVYFYIKKDDVKNKFQYVASVFTDTSRLDMVIDQSGGVGNMAIVESEHYFGEIPIVEYKNNENAIGDFELQISLIEAYNRLTSDRLNDKEQFLDAILVLKGAMLGEDEEQTGESVRALKELGLLELPENAQAEYLIKTLDENSVEVLRKALEEDIHKFSYVPCLTDDSFASNTSGVAMEYKLLGLEMITKIKERQYRKSLRKRIKLICNLLGIKAINIDYESVIANFSRGLPKNNLELAQMISSLDGVVSQETLLNQLPFIQDAQMEIERTKEGQQSQMFSVRDNEVMNDE